jgi:uncharacterized protein YabE (DUF348 family)
MTAQAIVLTAVVGGTVSYARHAKDVTLVLDGRTSTVQADASDVRGLLADEGILVSPRDVVAPGLDSPLRAGQDVVVRFARPLTLVADGSRRTYWTTELTLDAALSSLGIRSEDARLSTSRNRPLGRTGLRVELSRPKSVTVVADGRTREVTTTAPTVADLLTEEAIAVRARDRLSVMPAAPVVDGQVVALTRIERRRETVTEKVAPSTVRRTTKDLEVGARTVTPGRAGSRRVTYQVVLADGRPTSRTAVAATVVRKPVARVVTVGTRKPAPRVETESGESTAGSDGLNWAALARCESGGNPRAVNPAGYYGLYQFSPATWRSVGGSGLPTQASPAEQLRRAKILYRRAGAGQWGCGRHLFD